LDNAGWEGRVDMPSKAINLPFLILKVSLDTTISLGSI